MANKSLHQLKNEICDIGRRIYNKGFAAGNDAIPATFLGASRKWRVTRYELETPAELVPSRLAVFRM